MTVTASPNGSIYHCATLQFLLFFYFSFHAYYTHWNVIAVHGQGLFFSSGRKAFTFFFFLL